MTHSAGVCSAAPGVISVTGTDAASFLRAQLSNDVMRLGPDRHFLAAWCDAKGRAALVTRVLQGADGYLLLLPRALVESILSRLRLYVLRARVALCDATGQYRVDGVLDGNTPAVNRCERAGQRITLGLPGAGDTAKRGLVISPRGASAPAGALAVAGAAWQMAAVDAGVPVIYPATQGLFVPQMLNLHWLMAVDFDKGCYPGQEVIARLHYRGRLTRRLFRLAWAGGDIPVPGAAVFDAAGNAQGTVIRAAAENASRGRALAVLKLDDTDSALRTGAASLNMLALPYPTPR